MSAYYNDNEKFCCDVLRMNIQRGLLPEGFVDERSITEVTAANITGYQQVHLFAGIGGFPLGLTWANVPSHLRILTGGFPCQDISAAGKQAGITGERSGLWGEIVRLLKECNECQCPFDYVLIENVKNLLSGGDWQEETQEEKESEETQLTNTRRAIDEWDMGDDAEEDVFRSWMGTVLADLASCGYDATWLSLRASDVGAPHRRERVFIVAYPNSHRQRIGQSEHQRQPQRETTSNARYDGTQGRMAHASGSGWQECDATTLTSEQGHIAWRTRAPGNVEDATGRREWLDCGTGTESGSQPLTEQSSAWLAQSCLGGDPYGLPRGLDRHQWPAGPGEEQYSWEPARTTAERQPNRAKRLKALGNAIVPQLVALIGQAIVEHEIERGVA